MIHEIRYNESTQNIIQSLTSKLSNELNMKLDEMLRTSLHNNIHSENASSPGLTAPIHDILYRP